MAFVITLMTLAPNVITTQGVAECCNCTGQGVGIVANAVSVGIHTTPQVVIALAWISEGINVGVQKNTAATMIVVTILRTFICRPQ